MSRARVTPKEFARRVLIWGLVAAYFALCAVMLVRTGDFWVLLGWTGFPIVGAVILSARPAHPIGRLMLAIGLYWSVYGVFGVPSVAAQFPEAVEVLYNWTGYVVWLAVPAIIILFPTGRITSRFGRVVAGVLAALSVLLLAFAYVDTAPLSTSGRPNPFGIDALTPLSRLIASDATFAIVPAAVGVALVDLALRWRRSEGIRRLQFRWLAYGGALTIATVIPISLIGDSPLDAGTVLLIGLSAIPISIGIAVTRFGLYEIGRVVSRTVSYAVVTALAVGVYALVVTSATLLIPGAPAVGVALATLAAAALFLPALRWVQRWVDRRFDRERYVTEKVVDAFGERLRTGVDPATTVPDLLEAVERTLQPASVGIWTSGGTR